jgi:hypothetical protein
VSDTAPLAALLASHPEECAVVMAVLAAAEWNCPGGISVSRIRELTNTQDDGERMLSILRAVVAAGLAQVNTWCEYCVGSESVAVGIARMGAAAWLAQRCPPAPSSPSFDDREQASRDRLCDIHAMAVHYKHPTARAIRSILIGAGNGVPVGRDKYRGLLVRIGAYGVPLDVDAEVAAVWGEQAK